MNQIDLKISINQAGSAIIWIFIMIALFTALSFAVSSNMRGSVTNMSQYEIDLAATEIIDYARNVKETVQELRINGCTNEEIDFANTVYKNNNTGLDNNPIGGNTNAPTDGSCGIFNINGGGLRAMQFDLPETTPPSAGIMSGDAGYSVRNILGIGNDTTSDYIISIPGMNEEICLKINEVLDVENPGGSPPEEADFIIIGDEAPSLVNQNAFCYYRDNASPRHTFHQVLIAR